MNKTLTYNTIIIAGLGLLLAGCTSVDLVDNDQNTIEAVNQAKEDIAEIKEVIDDRNEEFVQDNQGGEPQEVVDTRFQELSDTYGAPDETFTSDNIYGEPNYAHAWIIAEELGLDYEELAFIQLKSGSFGMESLLEAMDQSNPAVADLTMRVQEYHAIRTANDPTFFAEYFADELGSNPDPQVLAERTVKAIADVHREFTLDDTIELTSKSSIEQVDTIVRLSGLSTDDITVIKANFIIEGAMKALPDELNYKADILELFAI